MKQFSYFILLATDIVSFGEVTNEQRAEAERLGLTIYSWDQFLKLVRES